jgi:hypothetical protein
MPPVFLWFGLLWSLLCRSSVKLRGVIACSWRSLRSAIDSAKELPCESIVHSVVLLLFTYCTMALPQHKTCLSILRSILGPGAGNEARFAEKIGRSTSWLKKASCGQIPLTRDAAIAIAYETGASMKWLLDGDTTKPLLDSEGNPYTLETYATYRQKDRDEKNREDISLARDEMAGCLHQLLGILGAANQKNRGGLFAFHLSNFVDEMADKFGVADIYQNEGAAGIAENVAHLVRTYDAKNAPKYVPGKKATPTPQKKQPSRKSKSSDAR